MPGIVPTEDLPQAAATDSSVVPSHDLPASLEVPEEDLPDNVDAAPTKPINNSKALVEGIGRTMTFGMTDALQHGIRSTAESLGSSDPDFWADSDEDVAARKDSVAGKTGEALGIAGGFMKGAGAPGFIQGMAKGLSPEATSVLGKIGAAGVASAIESGTVQAGDEISKAMLGKESPEAPVSSAIANIGGAGLLGFGMGATFNGVGQAGTKGLAAIENAKMGDKAKNVLTGMGLAAKAHALGVPEKEVKSYICGYFRDLGVGPEFDYRLYKPGVDLYYGGMRNVVGKATKGAVDVAAGITGYKAGGAGGALVAGQIANKFIAPTVEKILDKPLIGVTNKVAIPTIMYALSKGQTTGLFNALNYATAAAKGAKVIGKGVDAVLKGGINQAVDFTASEKDKQKIIDYLDNGGIEKEMQDSLNETPQAEPGFADGGEIGLHDQGTISTLYPAHDMMLNAAKGRVSNYLSSIRPMKNPSKLPFDPTPNLSEQDKTFNNAVSIAAAPLSILKSLKNGDIRAEDIKHFTSMYPELHQYLSKRFTEGIMNHQLEDEKLPYKTRQALSLFMGTALDSTMTPQAIMAAQSVFAPKQAPMPQGDKKSKGSPSKLGKEAKSYKTTDQAAESDRANRD